MKFIGITGGVGAGKSTVLELIRQKLNAKVYRADDIAKNLMQPGTDCYDRVAECFRDEDIFITDELLDKTQTKPRFDDRKLAKLIFSDGSKRAKINSIVHPAVKKYIMDEVSAERERGLYDFVFFEAALLIEDGYDELCDELWYVYANDEVRRERLKKTRNYTDEKIDGIFASQLKDEEYRRHCRVVIDNSGSAYDLAEQIQYFGENQVTQGR